MRQAMRSRLDPNQKVSVSPQSISGGNSLIVGQNPEGDWIVCDRLGLKGGIFASFSAALRFAKREAGAGGCGIELTAQIIETGFLSPLGR